MAQELPITVEQVLNLGAVGVSLDHVKVGTATMESDKFVCVCEQGSLAIVDLWAGNTMQRHPISADAAVINPVSPIIALRTENRLQIFNTELRTKMKSHLMSEAVVFWRWISAETIALVTASAVFHWSLDGDSPPILVFYRSASLGAGAQIVCYEASVDNQWLLLVGITQGQGGRTVGNMQLYSMEKKVSQVLQGYTGAFAQVKPPGRTDDAQILVYAGIKGDGHPLQLFIMEVGRDQDALVFHLPPQPVPFAADAQSDLPVSMLVSPIEDIVYMITQMGYLFVFDVHSGKLVHRARMMQDTPFVTCLASKSKGVLGITRHGQLLHFAINKTQLVPYVLNTLQDSPLILALATRMDLQGADELYLAEFSRLAGMHDIPGAARLAAVSPQGLLRTPQTIERFHEMPAQLDQPQPLLQYFSVLLDQGTLKAFESVELARVVLLQGRGKMLQKWLVEDKLECSEELGDLLAPFDPMMAMSVYLRAEVPEKVATCFMQSVVKESKLQDLRPLIRLCDRYNCVDELTQYMYSNNMMRYIEVFVTKVSPEKAPAVVGKLLDLDCNEDGIKNLLKQITDCPVAELCEQLEKRNRLPLLQLWLEKRVAKGDKEAPAHSALGKIYITLNKDPQQFLTTNRFYDSKVVGTFCEGVDPYLAFLVYKRAGRECDDDLIRVAMENGLFKDLARCLVDRQDLDMWGKVLMKQEEDEDPGRRALIDQVIQTAIPESTKPAQVSTTVHAFMNAQLSTELVEQNVSCVGMNRCFAFF
ncbi:hypothetical protein PHYPSEUDO_000761 [Phytophthora pseudosyringae]|uniref:Clathrin heavy chain n=1 Tax=Phytophthora pseudosyringae TaxID=221518 RepID=A0A8T1WK84_9STRA|nr:hypothetical protein PHYPSEUDO_000761 [Phytophthora pseudosyringae]